MDAAATNALEEVLPNLAFAVDGIDAEVLFQLSVDDLGRVRDIECLTSWTQPKNLIPLATLLERVVEVGASSVVYLSRGSGGGGTLEDCDLDFTERLIEAGRACGVEVRDHYVVQGGGYYSLRRTTDLWDGPRPS